MVKKDSETVYDKVAKLEKEVAMLRKQMDVVLGAMRNKIARHEIGLVASRPLFQAWPPCHIRSRSLSLPYPIIYFKNLLKKLLFWILCFTTLVPKTTNFCRKRSDRILYDIDLLADTKYVNQRELGSD